MKLFHLTQENQYKSSEHAPARLPENNYSYIEITYSASYDLILSVKGKYIYDTDENSNTVVRECILSDIPITEYINKVKDIQWHF